MAVPDSPSGLPSPDAPGPRLLSDAREASLAAGLIARDERALVQLVEVATPWLLAVAQAMTVAEIEVVLGLVAGESAAWAFRGRGLEGCHDRRKELDPS